MDKIILAFEFSENSNSALNMSLTIAERTNSVLEIVWVDNTLDDLVEIEKNTIHEHFDEILRSIVIQNKDKLPPNYLTYSIITGNVCDAIANKAAFEDVALIVVGTHEKKQNIETRWTNSTASKLVEKTNCPVLSVPSNYNFIDIKKIVVPIDFDFSTRQKAPMVTWIAKAFNAYIHIVGLLTSGDEEHIEKIKEYSQQVGRFFMNNQIEYEITYKAANNIAKEILAFAETKNANLISIMTRQEISISNILYGSYAHQIILRSRIPILTIRPLNINSLDQENLGT